MVCPLHGRMETASKPQQNRRESWYRQVYAVVRRSPHRLQFLFFKKFASLSVRICTSTACACVRVRVCRLMDISPAGHTVLHCEVNLCNTGYLVVNESTLFLRQLVQAWARSGKREQLTFFAAEVTVCFTRQPLCVDVNYIRNSSAGLSVSTAH